VYNSLIKGGLYLCLSLSVLFILWKSHILLSSWNQTTNTTTGSYPKPNNDPEPCKHKLSDRKQLLERDFPNFKDVTCKRGFSIQPTRKESGQLCLKCGHKWCPHDNCLCKTGQFSYSG
jgi:hypothetical protein